MNKLWCSLVLGFFLSFGVTGCYEQKEPQHVLLFIGDGMQLEHEIAASRYLTGKDNGLVFHSFEYKGNCTTWDIDTYNYYAAQQGADLYDPETFDPINGYNPELGGAEPYPFSFLNTQYDYFITNGYATDSASAATAIATGIKTDKGNIAWSTGDPEDGALETIGETLREQLGYAFGIVSTVQISHATPAAFASHNISRNNYGEIGAEIISSVKPDVVIGGGHHGWYADGNGDYRFLPEEDYNTVKEASEYVVAERATDENGAATLRQAAAQARKENKKLFGYFGGAEGNFESPVPSDTPGNPSFEINRENPTLADCVKSSLDVLSKNRDGFFVMFEQGDIDWANHANDYNRMIGTVYDLDCAVKAAIEYVNRPGDSIDWSNTTIIVTSDHSNSYMRLSEENILEKGDLPDTENFSDYVTYASGGHTNEPVRIYAKGHGKKEFKEYEGRWYPGTSLIDNTNIYEVIKKITGVN